MTAKHIAFGADDARGRMSAAADSAMTHAVEAAAAAREAKPLGAEASRLAKEAIALRNVELSAEAIARWPRDFALRFNRAPTDDDRARSTALRDEERMQRTLVHDHALSVIARNTSDDSENSRAKMTLGLDPNSGTIHRRGEFRPARTPAHA